MNRQDVIQEYKDAGALLEGHFKLSSGLHSPMYLQCARVLMDPERASRLCRVVADKIIAAGHQIELVVSPAMGGVIVGYEMARQLGVPAVFTERVEGEFALRRGFDIPEGAKILMMEDIITTGLSSKECIKVIREWGGNVVAAGCLVDRSNGSVDVGAPVYSLLAMDIPTYAADDLPASLQAIPAIKPGSRGLKS